MAWRVNSPRSVILLNNLLKHSIKNECMKKVPFRSTAFNFSAYYANVKILEAKTKLLTTKPIRSCLPLNIHKSAVCNSKVEKFTLSDIGEGIREVTVKEWFVKVNDPVNQFDNICEVQSDKASVTITSRFKGIIRKLYCDIDEVIAVGNPLCDIELDGADEESQDENVDTSSERDALLNNASGDVISNMLDHKKVLTTPAVRRLAMENKLKLSDIPGTGKDGRILKEDVLAYISTQDTIKLKPELKKAPVSQIPAASPMILEDKTVPITGFMKVMTKTMNASLAIPHFVYSDEIDVTNLMSVRLKLKPIAESQGVKLTFLPFFVKAASMTLNFYPIVNSSVDEACENIIYKAKHNIGIAMDTPAGLAVPNVKNVQSLTLLEVAEELNRLHNNGLKGTLQPSDVTGGTFTLSNIGAIGGSYTKPVILSPEVAIGALGKIQILPRFDSDGNVVKACILSISWAADHRVLDGATMARFSNTWKQFIENPPSMLLNLK